MSEVRWWRPGTWTCPRWHHLWRAVALIVLLVYVFAPPPMPGWFRAWMILASLRQFAEHHGLLHEFAAKRRPATLCEIDGCGRVVREVTLPTA